MISLVASSSFVDFTYRHLWHGSSTRTSANYRKAYDVKLDPDGPVREDLHWPFYFYIAASPLQASEPRRHLGTVARQLLRHIFHDLLSSRSEL
jgi:hypothetical protein